MRLNCVKTLKVKHRFEKAVGRGVAINRRHDVGTECVANRRVSFERVGVSSPDHLRGDLWTVEPLGDPVHDRCLQRVVMQDGRIDQGRELRLTADNVFGLAADTRPDRVDLVERAGFDLPLGHARLPQIRSLS